MKIKKLNVLLLSLFSLTLFSSSFAFARDIIDMRGKTVSIPDEINTIATISDGFVENILTHINKIDKVNVIGSWAFKRDYVYDFETNTGEKYQHKGLNTMKYLHPWLNDLICVNSPQGNIVDFEALAYAKPDVLIVRVGDCTVRSDNLEATERTLNTLESLEIPLVVLYTPAFYKNKDLVTLKEEAKVIGSLFGEAEANQAYALMEELEKVELMIQERTATIPENERKKVLYFGLNPTTREQGGAGTVYGTDTPESYIIEKVVHGINAFPSLGTNIPISAEQVYALDPDVILLPTMNGYHPAKELYTAPYYSILQDLNAVKNQEVYALPWTPMNCARRLEYPIDMLIMAKAVYPDLFQDINIYNYALDFYKKAYHVDEATATGLADTQILGWLKENNF